MKTPSWKKDFKKLKIPGVCASDEVIKDRGRASEMIDKMPKIDLTTEEAIKLKNFGRE